MKPVKVSEDIVPINEFKAKASRFLKQIADSGQSLVITQHGRPVGVVLSPAQFDRLLEQQRFLEAVSEGLADVEAGRVMSTAELRKRLAARRAARTKR